MNIAINTFQVESAGGLLNFNVELKKGFNRLGHKVDIYMLREKGKTKFDADWNANCLYYGDERYRDYVNRMKGYDLVIFCLPCPHQTKHTKDNYSWTKCYEGFDAKKFVVIHDAYWQKYYKWMSMVKDRIDNYIAIHHVAWESIKSFPDDNKKKVMIFMAIDTSPIPNNFKFSEDKKEDKVISTNWFKPWKHLNELIEVIPKINYPVEVCGDGIEYFYLKNPEKKPKYYIDVDKKTTYWDRALKNGMTWRHWIPYSEVQKMFKKGKVLVDLSRSKFWDWGNTTRVVMECMIYSVIPVLRVEGLGVYKPENVIPVPLGGDLSGEINKIMKNYDLRKEICERNYHFVRDNFDCTKVAKLYIDLYLDMYDQFDPLPLNNSLKEQKEYYMKIYYPNGYPKDIEKEDKDEISDEVKSKKLNNKLNNKDNSKIKPKLIIKKGV